MELAVDGRRVFAATGGAAFDPNLPVVAFVHGAGMDRTVWALQTRWFAWHGCAVLAVDLPGHGGSEGPALVDIESLGGWILRLLERSGASSATLVGHSMGALACLSAGAEGDDRVAAMALLGVGARMPVHPDLLAAARVDDPVARELIVDWGFGQPARFGVNRAPGLWMQGGGRSLLLRAPAGALGSDLAACDAYGSAAEAAARLDCPVLFVVGEGDRMTPPSAAAELAAKVAKARTATIRDAGHMMMIEKPDETLDALIGWMRDGPSSSPNLELPPGGRKK